MKLKFARSKLDKSIFLAGPTPRDEAILSWRPQAIEILQSLDFDGSVFIPESDDWKAHDDYDDQVHWEKMSALTHICASSQSSNAYVSSSIH